MPASVTRLCGDDWQRWANLLLARHYGPTEYQKIPDNQKGDAGIEGFTVASGHAYQAYGCEEPIGTSVRFEKQRNKMTQDVNKFVQNQAILQRLFGTTKITRWALFVPYFDGKEIVAHATRKTEEILTANLPYLGSDFRVVVCDEESFQAERDFLLNASSSALEILADPATVEEVTNWASQNYGPTATMEEKIGRLPALERPAKRQEFRDKVLKWYLEGQEILESLRKYPGIYEKVIKTKSHQENYLVTQSVTTGSPAELLKATLNGLTEAIQRETKVLSPLSAISLSHEAVADWLLRCPLDFPEPAQ